MDSDAFEFLDFRFLIGSNYTSDSPRASAAADLVTKRVFPYLMLRSTMHSTGKILFNSGSEVDANAASTSAVVCSPLGIHTNSNLLEFLEILR